MPIAFHSNEYILYRTVMMEREFNVRLSYEEATAFDEAWERDKKKMGLWIDSVINRRVSLG